MFRKELLSEIGFIISVLLTGCLDEGIRRGGSNDEPDLPNGLQADTHYIQENVISTEYSGRSGVLFEAYEEDFTLLSTRSNANTVFDYTTDIQLFVDETNFSESYILVVQTGMQSATSLSLASIDRNGDGITAELEVEGPETPGDDLTTHSLLIRITDENLAVPSNIEISIEGYR